MMKKLIKGYFELTKPRITLMVLITTALGYYLGGHGIHDYLHLFVLLSGSALVCSGASALNQYIEREFDGKMHRTKNRPIPSGLIKPEHAFNFGAGISILGVVILYMGCNLLTAFLGLLTIYLYVLVYTPMKRASWLNTTVGSFPGAIPPLGGWAAATGHLDFNAGILFLILFLWQHPHFYAIAWLCKEDYKRGGFKMLPLAEPGKRMMFHQIIWFSVMLIPISIVPFITGLTGITYFIGVSICSVALFAFGVKFVLSETDFDARNLLKASVAYFPLLLILIFSDAKF